MFNTGIHLEKGEGHCLESFLLGDFLVSFEDLLEDMWKVNHSTRDGFNFVLDRHVHFFRRGPSHEVSQKAVF